MRAWDVPHSVLGTLSLSNLNRADQKEIFVKQKRWLTFLGKKRVIMLPST